MDHTLVVLYVSLKSREDDSVQRSVYCKRTWIGRYAHLHHFNPLSYKRNLVRILDSNVRKVCSEDTSWNELKFIENMLRENGYADRFIRWNLLPKMESKSQQTVLKKELFIRGNVVSKWITRTRRSEVSSTFSLQSFHVYSSHIHFSNLDTIIRP